MGLVEEMKAVVVQLLLEIEKRMLKIANREREMSAHSALLILTVIVAMEMVTAMEKRWRGR